MMQLSLFGADEPKSYTYYPDFLTKQEADALLAHCKALKWQQNYSQRWGVRVANPRLELLYGSPKINYKYGGVTLYAEKWTRELWELGARINQQTGHTFQYVIGNLYRNGDDSIGWHADDDSSMGFEPPIASVSLGQMRLFQIKEIKDGAKAESIWLEHGSLLLMAPGMQQTHVHRVPKVTRGWCGERINLTFRPYKNA